MKLSSFCISTILPLLVSCAATRPQASNEYTPTAGALQVFTATTPRPDGDFGDAYPHAGYTIYDTQENFVRYVPNHVGRSDRVPTVVSVPSGQYLVQAEVVSGATFSVADIRDLDALAARLRQHPDKLSEFLWNSLSPGTRESLAAYGGANSDPAALRRGLVHDLNSVLVRSAVYEPQRFADVTLTKKTERLLQREPQGTELIRLNRMLLEDAYPQALAKGGEAFGRQKVPVVVEPGRTTMVHLENNWDKFDAHPESHLVRLDDGHVVGWRQSQ